MNNPSGSKSPAPAAHATNVQVPGSDEQPSAPNLFVPGAPKSGTSSLHAYLGQHPDIDMSIPKEPQTYTFDDLYRRRFDPGFQQSYTNIFDWKRSATYRGESSTTYFVSEPAARRMLADSPAARLLIVLRNPVDRIVSHYNWLAGRGASLLPFRDEVCVDEGLPFDPQVHFDAAYKNYLLESSYAVHVGRFLETFGTTQVHVMEFEELCSAPLRTLNGAFEFLGLPTLPHIDEEHANRSAPRIRDRRPGILRATVGLVPRSLRNAARRIPALNRRWRSTFFHLPQFRPTPDDRRWLADRLRDDVARLREITGLAFPSWQDFA